MSADELATSAAISAFRSRWAHEVQGRGDRRALEAINEYDVVLTDLPLPVSGGMAALRNTPTG